jgi:hypothetical protein
MIDQGFLFRLPPQTQHGTVTVEFMNRAIEAERESIIQIIKAMPFSNWFQFDVIEAIRARGEQA